MEIEKIITQSKKVDIKIKGVKLLSKEEYKDNKDIIPSRPYRWWLKNSVENTDDWNNIVHAVGVVSKRQSHSVLGVSPALEVELPVGFKRGDKLRIAGYLWTVLSSTLIHCDNVITEMAYKANWRDSNSNTYETSDIKEWLDNWFVSVINN